MEKQTDLLIIGAGPFGLAMAAYAGHLDIDHILVGKPMAFWKEHMPAGMVLRSACDWHLDPTDVYTIERYLESQGRKPADVEPLSLQFYLGYAQWFQEQAKLEPIPAHVHRLDVINHISAGFQAELENGGSIRAKYVALAIGFKHFAHEPPELIDRLPDGSFEHTCDLVDPENMRDRRCLIVGGRQSAFEWAALLNEAGAAAIHISHRHDSPRFAEADWSWVSPLVERFDHEPGWYRRLSPEEREAVNYQFWVEGRLKVEPWLEPRLRTSKIKVWPRTQIISARRERGDIVVQLDSGDSLTVDRVILATGYKADIMKAPFLAQDKLLATLALKNGCPVLNDHLQTTIPGLFTTSLLATQDFGPFFAFTVSARTSARVVINAIAG
jgi:thioredoxin reductase